MPTCSRDYSGTVLTNDCIANASPLPSGVVDSAYSETLTAPSLTAPLVWVVLNGTLPDGLELGEDSGEIFGVPTLDSDYSFQIQVTDANGVQCLKNFTLDVTEAGDGCGWWNDFPFNASPSVPPNGVPSWTPVALTGATDIAMSVPAWIPPFGGSLTVSGTKTYTGPEVILKIHVVVAFAAEGAPSIVVSSALNGILVSETFAVSGAYDYTVSLPVSVADGITVTFTLGGSTTYDVTLTSCESTIGAADGFYLVGSEIQSLFYYAATGVANPTATITVTSNKPVTWDIANNFPDSSWAVAPSLTLDGVPQTFHFESGGGGEGNWIMDLATVDTDGCVVKTFVISGPTIADPFGVGVFQIVPQS